MGNGRVDLSLIPTFRSGRRDVSDRHDEYLGAARAAEGHHFPVVLEQEEDGMVLATCPAFARCRAYGRTVEEALVHIEEAIWLCLEEDPSKYKDRFLGLYLLEMRQRD